MILYCDTCNAFVNTEKIADYKIDEEIDENYETYLQNQEIPYRRIITVEHIFLKCVKCLNPFIIKKSEHFNQSENYEPAILSNYEVETLYPTSEVNLGYCVPDSVKEAYKEALICYKNRAFVASVIMCRKAIEGICKVHNIDKGSLKTKLLAMKDNEIIEKTLFEWADNLRLLGNDAAHEVDISFSFIDASDTIDFTHAIIEYIFTYKKKFNDFKKRIKSNSKT